MRRITKFSLLLSLVLGLYFPTVFAQSNMTNEMFDLAKLKSGVKNSKIITYKQRNNYEDEKQSD